jgi:hypothetical protein
VSGELQGVKVRLIGMHDRIPRLVELVQRVLVNGRKSIPLGESRPKLKAESTEVRSQGAGLRVPVIELATLRHSLPKDISQMVTPAGAPLREDGRRLLMEFARKPLELGGETYDQREVQLSLASLASSRSDACVHEFINSSRAIGLPSG